MKKIENQARHGDVLLTRIDEIPSSAKLKKFDGETVIAHSETGHHHAFGKNCGVQFFETSDPMVCYLKVSTESLLEHHRSFDTHESFSIPPGIYEIRRPAEYVNAAEKRMIAD